MKRLFIPFMLVFLSIGISCQLNAQKDKKEKTVKIKIEKEVDGKKTVIDTTFVMKDGEDVQKVLEKYGVKADIHHQHASKIKIDVETDDSLHKESNAMVWISVDDNDDGHKHIIKKGGHDKMIFITEDGDVEIIKIKNGNKILLEEIEEDIIIEELEGDSVKVKTKIIIKTDKGGKHKIKRKIYNITADSIKGENVFIYSDDDTDDEHVIIKEIKGDNDSIDIIIKKIKKGKHGKHGKKVIITSDGDYTWTVDEDEDIVVNGKEGKLKKVRIEILDIDDAGLKILKQKKDYKKFTEKDFNVFVDDKEDMIKFNFSTSPKGSLSVKIVNEKGKTILEDVTKKFDGKYKNKIKAKSGTYYIQISQGKKHYIRKMIFEWAK